MKLFKRNDPDAAAMRTVLGFFAVIVLIIGGGYRWQWYRAGVQAELWQREGVQISRWEVFTGAKPVERTFTNHPPEPKK